MNQILNYLKDLKQDLIKIYLKFDDFFPRREISDFFVNFANRKIEKNEMTILLLR